jgi:hypothetical protein
MAGLTKIILFLKHAEIFKKIFFLKENKNCIGKMKYLVIFYFSKWNLQNQIMKKKHKTSRLSHTGSAPLLESLKIKPATVKIGNVS